MASLLSSEDDVEEWDESDFAQAQEAYSYTRALMAHWNGQSGSTPPPAPSTGKGLTISGYQAGGGWMPSPALSASAFSDPSSASLSSPSTRPRSASTRNSFSSVAPSFSDADRSSWQARRSSVGQNHSRRQDIPPFLLPLASLDANQVGPRPSRPTSSNSNATSSKHSSTAVIPSSSSGVPAPKRHQRSTTLPPALFKSVKISSSPRPTSFAAAAPIAITFGGHSPRLLSQSPSPMPTGGAPSHKSLAGPNFFPGEEESQRQLGRPRPSSLQPDMEGTIDGLSRSSTVKGFSRHGVRQQRRGTDDGSKRRDRPDTLSLTYSNHNAPHTLEEMLPLQPHVHSAPIDEGERQMIEDLGLGKQDLRPLPIHMRQKSSDGLCQKQQIHTLGSRRKSIDFAVKVVGRWTRRKSSVGARSSTDSLHEQACRGDKVPGRLSKRISGNFDVHHASAKTSASSFLNDGDEWAVWKEGVEGVPPPSFWTSSKSSSPAPSRRKMSVSSAHRFIPISRPISSEPQPVTPREITDGGVPLEEMHPFSSRLARIESLNAVSGAFKNTPVEYTNDPAEASKKGRKGWKDIPLSIVKKRLSQQELHDRAPITAAALPSSSALEEEREGLSALPPTPTKQTDGGRDSVTPTQKRMGGKQGRGPSKSQEPQERGVAERKKGPRCPEASLQHTLMRQESLAEDGTLQHTFTKNTSQTALHHTVSSNETSSVVPPASPIGLLAKKSYSALMNAFANHHSSPSLSKPTLATTAGDIPQNGDGPGAGGSAWSVSSGAHGYVRSQGPGRGSGPGGSNGDFPGGDGGKGSNGGGGGGRPPGGGGGGGGGAHRSGRSSPPIQSIFRRMELVGRGAYGAVYRGVHVASGAVVALKVVNLDTPEDDVSDIQREVALLSQLRETSTKNVVKYWGCWLTGSELWIVMDFAEGGSVRTVMKAGPVAEKYAAVVVRESLVALNYLHKSGIIHRDIKAANILLTTSGKVLLCDFGVAASLSSSSVHSKRSTFVGTPYWMAPEVITQGKTYDQSADIWSLGITIYEMVTGNPPLSDQEQMRAIMLIPKNKPPRLPVEGPFSNLLREFVALCLNEEPKERPSAEELSKSKWIKASAKIPNSILRDLISAYAAWTKSGGMRMSLLGAEASELSEANQRDSFAFDAVDNDEGWEFNTVNSRTMQWPTSDQPSSAAVSAPPPRDHPLLRLFQGEGEDLASVPQHQQPPASRSTQVASHVAPTPTYLGQDVRPAPAPPGPVPERPALAPLTSAALDKGSFTGMGATPFRFGKTGGGAVANSPVLTDPSSVPAHARHQAEPSGTSTSEENAGAEMSLAVSSYSFHQAAGSSSANTSFSTEHQAPGATKSNESTEYGSSALPSSAPEEHHRQVSTMSATSSTMMAKESGSKGHERPTHGQNKESSSHYSHSRERSEATSASASASASASLASEKRNAGMGMSSAQLPPTPLPLHRSEGKVNQTKETGSNTTHGSFLPSSDNGTSTSRHYLANQSPGNPSQRPHIGIRSRSGSRSRPMEGASGPEYHDWLTFSRSGQPQPPLPTPNAAALSRGNAVSPHMPTPVVDNSSPLHSRRQHGGSDPTQLLNRASKDLSLSRETEIELAKKRTISTTNLPPGAPPLRVLELNLLMEKEDVCQELERTVEDLAVWLDVVGSGLAQVAAQCA